MHPVCVCVCMHTTQTHRTILCRIRFNRMIIMLVEEKEEEENTKKPFRQYNNIPILIAQ